MTQLLTFCSGSGGGDDDDYEGYTDPNYFSACTAKYTDLKTLEDARSSLPDHCVDKYIVDVQIAIQEGALQKYKTLVDSGYDKKFEIYEKFAKAQVPEQINNFMATDKVDKYFKCQEVKFGRCCNTCRFDACLPGCVKGGNCKGGLGTYDIECRNANSELVMVSSTVTSQNVRNGIESSLIEGFICGMDHDRWDATTNWVCDHNSANTKELAMPSSDYWIVRGQQIQYCLVGQEMWVTL
jgi:hypothetical protein